MQIIDFDAYFSDYLNQWMEKNANRFHNADEMEDAAPEVYITWLNTPAQWLGGKCPGEAFDDCDNADELIALLIRYMDEDVSVPDPLMDRIVTIGNEQAVLTLVKDGNAPIEARMMGVDFLNEMESTAPMVDYLRWQVERKEDEDLLDKALDSLREMGEQVKGPAKIAFRAADQMGKDALLEVLCDFPGDEEVFQYTLERFKTDKLQRALFAGYLAKLEDDHALEALLDVAESDDVSYIDFIEIRSAIERLGSEAPVRDFSNDPTYKAVKRLQVNPFKGKH
ncbi:MAG: hypothetical protein E7319_04840 [Clostridiales bacterium]|nr:hypothetical protein [Clostridiales bacterium]